jgi:hypothetical protein
MAKGDGAILGRVAIPTAVFVIAILTSSALKWLAGLIPHPLRPRKPSTFPPQRVVMGKHGWSLYKYWWSERGNGERIRRKPDFNIWNRHYRT